MIQERLLSTMFVLTCFGIISQGSISRNEIIISINTKIFHHNQVNIYTAAIHRKHRSSLSTFHLEGLGLILRGGRHHAHHLLVFLRLLHLQNVRHVDLYCCCFGGHFIQFLLIQNLDVDLLFDIFWFLKVDWMLSVFCILHLSFPILAASPVTL